MDEDCELGSGSGEYVSGREGARAVQTYQPGSVTFVLSAGSDEGTAREVRQQAFTKVAAWKVAYLGASWPGRPSASPMRRLAMTSDGIVARGHDPSRLGLTRAVSARSGSRPRGAATGESRRCAGRYDAGGFRLTQSRGVVASRRQPSEKTSLPGSLCRALARRSTPRALSA
jgi:hypothetical protein